MRAAIRQAGPHGLEPWDDGVVEGVFGREQDYRPARGRAPFGPGRAGREPRRRIEEQPALPEPGIAGEDHELPPWPPLRPDPLDRARRHGVERDEHRGLPGRPARGHRLGRRRGGAPCPGPGRVEHLLERSQKRLRVALVEVVGILEAVRHGDDQDGDGHPEARHALGQALHEAGPGLVGFVDDVDLRDPGEMLRLQAARGARPRDTERGDVVVDERPDIRLTFHEHEKADLFGVGEPEYVVGHEGDALRPVGALLRFERRAALDVAVAPVGAIVVRDLHAPAFRVLQLEMLPQEVLGDALVGRELAQRDARARSSRRRGGLGEEVAQLEAEGPDDRLDRAAGEAPHQHLAVVGCADREGRLPVLVRRAAGRSLIAPALDAVEALEEGVAGHFGAGRPGRPWPPAWMKVRRVGRHARSRLPTR